LPVSRWLVSEPYCIIIKVQELVNLNLPSNIIRNNNQNDQTRFELRSSVCKKENKKIILCRLLHINKKFNN
jgi:hypothetical protein